MLGKNICPLCPEKEKVGRVVLEEGNKRCMNCNALFESNKPSGKAGQEKGRPYKNGLFQDDGGFKTLDLNILDNLITSAATRTKEARDRENAHATARSLEEKQKKAKPKPTCLPFFSIDDDF